MQNIFRLIFIFLFFTACQQKVNLTDIPKINGYWEIDKVILPDNIQKDYSINLTYDYFEIGKENKGFRKKVTPQLDGKFLVDDSSEIVEIIIEKDYIYLKYTTPYNTWKEELKFISDQNMEIVNEDNKTYFYKKIKETK